MLDRWDALRHDIAYSLRQLRRAPGFTAAVMATFALGIGANATMFGVVDRLFFRPPAFVREPEQVVALRAGVATDDIGQTTLNYPVFKALRDNARGFEQVVAVSDESLPLGRGEDARSVQAMLVSASYFPMLGVSPAVGRFFRMDEDVEPIGAPVVVISHAFWMEHFGGRASAVGATLPLADRQFTIVGIAPKGFSGIELTVPDLWMPISSGGHIVFSRSWATNSGGSWLRVYGRLRNHVPLDQAATDAMRIAREAAPNAFFTGKAWRFTAVPIMRSRAADQGANASVALLLGGMSFVVLLIACSNVANLLLARGMRRSREVAVRLALGVGRARLVRQLLTESLLLAVLGGMTAMVVAYWGTALTRRLLFGDLGLDAPLLDGRMLAFTIVVALVVGVLTGLIPALQTTRTELVSALKAGTRDSGSHRSRTRAALLVVQAALCFVLLVGAGLFARSLSGLGAMRLGVDIDRVLFASMNLQAVGRARGDVDAIFARVLERVQGVPGVASAAVAGTVPFGSSFGTQVAIPGPDSLRNAFAMFNVVSPDYFRTLGSRLVSGRDFSASDAETAPRVMIINDMMAKQYWGSRNPVGECLRIDESPRCATVIGVVENVRRQSIYDDSTAFVYYPLAQARDRVGDRRLVVRPAGGDPTRLIEPVRRAMQTAAPQLPFAEVQLAKDASIVRTELRPFRLGVSMFGMFGALALLLATVGVYAVISYDVSQRTRELGVRMALGARAADVVGLVITDGLRVIAIGLAGGLGVALLGARFVAPMLYQTSARDPLVIAAVAAVLLLVTVFACLLPARRASRVDASVAMRADG